MDGLRQQGNRKTVTKNSHDFPKNPLLATAVGFSFVQIQPNKKTMNTNTNNYGSPGRDSFRADPLGALINVLDELTSLYKEAGVPPEAARIAALADFECDFGVLPLAA